MNMGDRKPHIMDLPHQLLVHIFKKLRARERNIASETCRSWYITANDYSFIKRKVICYEKIILPYRKNNGNSIKTYINSPVTFYNYTLNVSGFKNLMNDFFVQLGGKIRSLKIHSRIYYKDVVHILNSCKELQVLSLECCDFIRPKDPSTIANNKNNYELPNLKSLDLSNSNVSDAIFDILVKHSPAIEELNLSDCDWRYDSKLRVKYKNGSIEYTGAETPSTKYFTFSCALQFIKTRSKKIKHLMLPEINDTVIILLSKVKDLFLESLQFDLTSNITTEDLLSEFIIGQKFLKKLVPSYISDKLILDICTFFTDLEHLNIRDCDLTDYGISQLHNLNKLRTLILPQSCFITNEGITRGLNQQRNYFLQELKMFSLENLRESTLIGVLELFPNLKQLKVSYCQNAVTDKSLQVIFKCQTQLEVLSLPGCEKILYLGICEGDDEEPCNTRNDKTKPGLYSLKKLKILELFDCCNIKSKFIKRSFHLPNLVQLNLNGCLNITDKSMEYVVQNCPNIEKLHVRGCSYLTDKTMEICRTSLKYLKFLDISVGQN